MGSLKKERQLQRALVCGSSGTGGGGHWQVSQEPREPSPATLLSSKLGLLERSSWSGTGLDGAHIHHCYWRMSKPGTFGVHNYWNGSICQLSHICSSIISGVESTCWLRTVLVAIQERELVRDPRFRYTLRTNATFQHSVNKLSCEMVTAIRHSISMWIWKSSATMFIFWEEYCCISE